MTERAQALEAATAQFVEAYRFALRSSEGDERPAILAMKAAYKAAEAALAVPPPPPVGSPTTERCDVCGEPAIREFCYAAEPWVPYCGLHCPQYAPVGERQLKSTPVEPAGASEPPSDYIDIVFDGPPASESGRFIEVENAQGASIRVGEWVHRPDGYWALRLPAPVSPVEPTPNDTLLRNIRMAAAMGLSFGHQATPQPMERMVERKDKRLRQILTLLAEHGVTGSMLRAESNAPVEPTPEPTHDAQVCVWREIETAPKDGTRVLVAWEYWSADPFVAYFKHGRWNSEIALSECSDDGPTHWMPLPTPPVVGTPRSRVRGLAEQSP